ncbi:MAG: VanZ family protein [Phycisphaerae bacterium]|nr:VanZ family protein [Phycisphaerae bacterium]
MRPMPSDKTRSGFRRRWLFASLASMALVLVLTHIPQEVMPKVLNRHLLDKVEHVGAYGLITILFLLSLPNGGSRIPAVVGLLVLAGVGILDETTQPLVNRIASVGDYASDLIGIALACLVFLVKKRLEADTVCS